MKTSVKLAWHLTVKSIRHVSVNSFKEKHAIFENENNREIEMLLVGEIDMKSAGVIDT